MAGSCISLVSLYGGYLRLSVSAAGLSSQTVNLDGNTTIHFWGPLSSSSSKPALVLIHGFGPPGIWQWKPQILFFSRKFNVYVPDLVFFGKSFSDSSERTEIFQAKCIAKLLQHLGVQRYSVVGTSYGGFVAYRLAEMWPEKVEKVVIASSAVNLRLSDNERLSRVHKADKIEDLLCPASVGGLRSFLPSLIYRPPAIMPDFVLHDLIEKFYNDNRKEKLGLLKGLSIGHDENVTVSPLPQDVLIVWGENDGLFLMEKAYELEKLMGQKARLEVMKKTAHLPQMENPSRFNNVVLAFLNGI